jgi:hypothetical protein
VVNPSGRVVWFGYFYESANPASGKAAFRLCRSQALRGRYKLKAVVSNQHFSDVETRRLPTERFRLR